MKILKIIILLIPVAISLVLLAIWLCNCQINKKSEPYIFDHSGDIPSNKAGLLLGTAKYVKSGNPNEYFMNRIKAAVNLYRSGKIKYIVVSGDNSRPNYNEPLDMKNELLKNGVPDSVIYLDYAGFRTLDSVIRMQKIFGQTQFTIISQKFHNQRAVYLARVNGLTAYGYNAEDVNAYKGFKTNVREKFARVKVFIDLLFDKQPKFLGEPVHIP